jgi:calcineurin-like phosphoesterase family protein
MTSKILRILQIGDLHYDPENKSFLDQKDSAFSKHLSSMISTSPVEDSLRSIITNAEKKDCDAIVVMGDIGDKGKKNLYREGVHFLLDAMTENPILKERIVVLPGNHDVNRDDALIGITEKFKHIAVALQEVGLSSVDLQRPTVRLLSRGNCGALLFALNSCIGCGERRFLPERIGEKIQTLITEALQSTSPPQPFDSQQFPDMLTQYYEQLDTPAFDAKAIDELFSRAAESTVQESSVFIVASHHNLLPQAQPRIAPYSELINGGQFRNHLLQLNRPVIYLHGHVHSEIIEIVQQPSNPQSMILCISAPLVNTGYNIIEIMFNEEGAAFGCRVVQYRMSDGGKIVEQPEHLKVPFYRTIEQAMNALNGKIMAYVFSQRGPAYWPDLLKHLRESDSELTEETLRDAIRELSWNRYLVLRNESQQHKLWRIEGTI